VKSKIKPTKIAGVLLAAGGSSRLGFPKQLIQFQGTALIRHIISVIHEGGITDLFVVLGAYFDQIEEEVKGCAHIIHNPNWEAGLSTSIKCAIEVINDNYDAAIIFIVDQPFLDAQLIRRLLAVVNITEADIIATRAAGQLTPPVLYRRAIFSELMSLKGNSGGKVIVQKGQTTWIDWPDREFLFDIDTLEDIKLVNRFSGQVPSRH